MRGKKLTAVDVKPQMLSDLSGCLVCSFKGLDGYEAVDVTMRPLYDDNMTGWLPLNKECRFRFPRSKQLGKREREFAASSFYHWLSSAGTPGGSGSVRNLFNNKQGDAKPKEPNRRMHDLHRLYWAVRSNRNKVADVLLRRCKQPIVAGLFAAKLYSHHKLPRNHVPDVTQKARYMPHEMRLRCESYAVDVINQTNLDQTTTAFDEYVFYSTGMEESKMYREFVHTEQARIDNETIRDALQLMGVTSDHEVVSTMRLQLSRKIDPYLALF